MEQQHRWVFENDFVILIMTSMLLFLFKVKCVLLCREQRCRYDLRSQLLAVVCHNVTLSSAPAAAAPVMHQVLMTLKRAPPHHMHKQPELHFYDSDLVKHLSKPLTSKARLFLIACRATSPTTLRTHQAMFGRCSSCCPC
jgi:hypothetical protein